MSVISELLDHLRGRRGVFLQTHNFPDHDAVASVFALQALLAAEGIPAELIYDGELQRDSLRQMIAELGIAIRPQAEVARTDDDEIIVVDGCKGNKNVTDLVGTEIAVIDHHQVAAPDDVPFVDIRPEVGACSTIVHSYFEELGHEVPRRVATALLIGLNTDTALLTRGVSEADVTAFARLYRVADVALNNAILRNYIQTKDLDFFRFAWINLRIEDSLAFCHFPDGCNQNLLGILGDFFLAVQEVDFVVLAAHNAAASTSRCATSARDQRRRRDPGGARRHRLRRRSPRHGRRPGQGHGKVRPRADSRSLRRRRSDRYLGGCCAKGQGSGSCGATPVILQRDCNQADPMGLVGSHTLALC